MVRPRSEHLGCAAPAGTHCAWVRGTCQADRDPVLSRAPGGGNTVRGEIPRRNLCPGISESSAESESPGCCVHRASLTLTWERVSHPGARWASLEAAELN